MPVKVVKDGSQFCLEDGEGKRHGSCHDTKEDATAQAEAINANLSKESVEKSRKQAAQEKGEYYYVPWGVTSYEELDAVHKQYEVADSMDLLVYQYHQLVDNIFGDDELEDKAAGLAALVSEFESRMNTALSKEAEKEASTEPVEAEIPPGMLDKFKSIITEALGVSRRREKDLPDATTGILFVKGDDGRYRWFARYSNSFRDQDNPPEIISSKSHERFVKMVEDGKYPLPELWLWHQKEWKWGEATQVAWDESLPGAGFALAAGLVDKGKEWIADTIIENNIPLLVSHGMPYEEIVKDRDGVYQQHQTVEISPLPPERAANQLTGFQVFTKEKTMALSDEKRQSMAESLQVPTDALKKLEASNTGQAKAAVDAGVEHKEKNEPDADPVKEEGTTPEPQPEFVSVDAFKAFQEELVEGIRAALTPLAEGLKAQQKEIAELRKTSAEKEKESMAPAASLFSQLSQPLTAKSAGEKAEELKDAGPDEPDYSNIGGLSVMPNSMPNIPVLRDAMAVNRKFAVNGGGS